MAESLARVAPLAGRWVGRLLAEADPALTVAQYLVLHAVAPGRASAGELARATDVSAAAISQLLAGLEAAGLVARTPAPADRRRQLVALTPGGAAALRAATSAVRDPLARLVAELASPELDALARALPDLERLLTGTAPPARPRRPSGTAPPAGPRRPAPPPRLSPRGPGGPARRAGP